MELELKFMVEKSFEPRLRALGYKAGQFCRQLDTYYIVDETIGGFRTWLRIREDTVNKSASIGLRRLVSDNASEKTETVFAPEDAGKMKQVMAACGKRRNASWTNSAKSSLAAVLPLRLTMSETSAVLSKSA